MSAEGEAYFGHLDLLLLWHFVEAHAQPWFLQLAAGLPSSLSSTMKKNALEKQSFSFWRGAQYASFFPKQLTVGVLNATLDLAALVLVGVVGFLGSEVVLSPIVSHCLRLSPFMWGVGVGWCGRLLGL